MRKPIPGFKNYECDMDGNIYTIPHTTMRLPKPFKDGTRSGKIQEHHEKGGLKTITLNNVTGYKFCCVVNDENKRVTLYQHRAVWAAFNGPIDKGYELDHKNSVRSDNRLENLQLVTRSENCKLIFERRKEKLKC